MLIRFSEARRNEKTVGRNYRAINIYFDRHNNLKRYTNFRLPATICRTLEEAQNFCLHRFVFFRVALSLAKWRMNS